nr:YgjV family protein [Oscillospiraceae bacterium]
MKTTALIVGLAAVFFFLLSYQFPKRKAIITCNVISRVLYILQYLLLFAFEGAAMDLSAIPSSTLAARKHTPFVQRHKWAILISVNAFVIGIGILVWQDWLSWVPIVGVLLETNALWLSQEKHIRCVSLAALPFWLFYNMRCGAYGAALGNVLAIVSVVMAILRYDFRAKYKTK